MVGKYLGLVKLFCWPCFGCQELNRFLYKGDVDFPSLSKQDGTGFANGRGKLYCGGKYLPFNLYGGREEPTHSTLG